MIEIKPAQFQELPQLRQIAIQTQLDTFAAVNTKANMDAFIRKAYDLAQLQKEWHEPESVYKLAWEGKVPVGFSRVRRNPEVDDLLGPNTLELQRLYVLTDYLGKKVGAALMQDVLDFSRKKKFDWLWLGVWEHNVKAQAFYARWGFVRFSEHVFRVGDDPQTDWLLRLKP